MQAISTEHSSRSNSTSLDLSSGTKQPRSRHRASVACSACRERRIRCVVPPGEDECVQCRRSGLECIIKNDDERRKPISRAYVNSLTSRIAFLESIIKEHGITIPSAAYPPQTTKTSSQSGDDQAQPQLFTDQHISHGSSTPANEPGTPDLSALRRAVTAVQTEVKPGPESRNPLPSEQVSPSSLVHEQDHDFLERLLSTRGHLSWDQLSGKLRYYGPTSHPQIYLELDQDNVKDSREAHEQARRAERLIRTLPRETHDYLMHLFWQHYNSVLHVVHEDAFMSDKGNGDTRFYSGFLHVCILAMGYRFADKSRPDVQRIALPARESTIHREAKYMLDLELERPGGIPSVAALLILGDVEVGAGRDNVGWMYAGMAIRLAYDLGLHLDSRQSGMSELEKDIRNMTLWACVIFDRYWSLFLGRPTSMKSADLEVYSLAQSFERLGSCKPAGPDGSLNTRIYEALIDLMMIGGKIVELPEHHKQASDATKVPDHSSYLRMIAIDRELRQWASRLPEDLRYQKSNLASAPFAFFMLHQQYHSVLILLHRPFARYDNMDVKDGRTTSALDTHFSNASRGICTKSAVAIACIFWQHRKRFDGRVMFSGAMQHAGTAAMALTAALAYTQSAEKRNMNMRYLEVLYAALQDMSHMLHPAEKMSTVLRALMTTLRMGQRSETSQSGSPYPNTSVVAESTEQGNMYRGSYSSIASSIPVGRPNPSSLNAGITETPQHYYPPNNNNLGMAPQALDAGWPAFPPSSDMAPVSTPFLPDVGVVLTNIPNNLYSWQDPHNAMGVALPENDLHMQYPDTSGAAEAWSQSAATNWSQW